MALQFRLAHASEYECLEKMIIDSFEPITWFRKLDDNYGPLNGVSWRRRWQSRFDHIFHSQMVLLGEVEGAVVAYASGTLDPETRLGFIDLLAVDRRFQGRGFGREMLRGMLEYLKSQGAVYAHLECLSDNDVGNALYRTEGFEEVARSIRWFKRL